MRPYVRAANVGWGGWKLDDVKSMNFTDAEMQTYRLEAGDLLLGEASGSAAEVGKPAIWNGEIRDCAFQNTLIRVRPRTANSRYLLHYFGFCASTGRFAKNSRGVGIYHLGRKALAEWEIPLPPIEEQRRIAAILDAADALRAKRRPALAKLDTLTQAIFIDMFGDPVNGDEYRFDELAVAGRGTFSNGPFGSDLLTSELTEAGVPVIYIRDIREGEYKRVSTVFVTEDKAQSLSTCQVQPGDVLVAKVGDPPGTAAVYPVGAPVGIVTQDVIRIRPDHRLILPQFLAHLINSRSGEHLIRGITVAATRSRFGLRDLKALSAKVPTLVLQERYSSRVHVVERLRSAERIHLCDLDTLFASLQQRAFRGEL